MEYFIASRNSIGKKHVQLRKLVRYMTVTKLTYMYGSYHLEYMSLCQTSSLFVFNFFFKLEVRGGIQKKDRKTQITFLDSTL